MKKHFLLAFFALIFLGTANAQIELKINPLGLLFGSPDFSAEYIVNEDIGVEFGLGLDFGTFGNELTGKGKKSGFNIFAAGKYYFSPDDGADKFYVGVYLRPRTLKYTYDNATTGSDFGYKNSAFGVGLLGGYKWVGARGILFELAVGYGKAFGSKITYNDPDYDPIITADILKFDFLGRLAIGYRLGSK